MNADQLKIMRDRAVFEITSQLECSVNFLSKYQDLYSKDVSVLDDRYSDFDKYADCFYSCISKAVTLAQAFESLFKDSEYSEEFKNISVETFQLNFLNEVFQTIDVCKPLISALANSLLTGTLISTSNIKEAA
jgi:hypothetical protein